MLHVESDTKKRTQIKRTSNHFEHDMSHFELTQNQVHPPKPNFEPKYSNLSKKLEPSKNPELRTQELGFTQPYIISISN